MALLLGLLESALLGGLGFSQVEIIHHVSSCSVIT
jgi:hypothetical protein